MSILFLSLIERAKLAFGLVQKSTTSVDDGVYRNTDEDSNRPASSSLPAPS